MPWLRILLLGGKAPQMLSALGLGSKSLAELSLWRTGVEPSTERQWLCNPTADCSWIKGFHSLSKCFSSWFNWGVSQPWNHLCLTQEQEVNSREHPIFRP
jgi:hypothetical protein